MINCKLKETNGEFTIIKRKKHRKMYKQMQIIENLTDLLNLNRICDSKQNLLGGGCFNEENFR